MLAEEKQSARKGGHRCVRTEDYWLSLMPEAELEYSLNEVKRAGKILREAYDPLKTPQAIEVFENWRNCHTVPLNIFYDTLQNYALNFSPLTSVVHRPKRREAVIKKLKRDPRAQLSTMQDIAGCRAIVKNIEDIDPFVEACNDMFSQHGTPKVYPYIDKPDEDTGYRGIHLVYKFRSDNESFNGRSVEIQIRTREQHAWATAVETVDIIHRDSLKSGHGDPQWQRFFSLMSSAIAYRESSPLVPNTPSDPRELENELRHYQELLQVAERLQLYGAIASVTKLPTVNTADTWVFLIELDVDSKQTTVKRYGEWEVGQAYLDVAEAERAGKNVVLAGALDFHELKEAYPNWFIDTHNFLMILKMTLGEDIMF
jgi:ppGpp synthetase/RelA/SpoT-type nucleotidyltranferase